MPSLGHRFREHCYLEGVGAFRTCLICWLCTGSVGIGIWNHSVNPSATPLVMGILERSGLVQHQCLKS